MGAIDIASLSLEERLRLLDELDREGPVGIPWDKVLANIQGRTQ